MDNDYKQDFLYFDEAICRALYLSGPRSVTEYDKIVLSKEKNDIQKIGSIAKMFADNAVGENGRAGSIKRLMVESLLSRFKIEAQIHSFKIDKGL